MPTVGLFAGVPYPPGRPQVLAVDGDRALIVWDPPVVQTTAAPVAGYQVEYRVAGTNNWVASNDFLIPDCRHEGTLPSCFESSALSITVLF